MKPPRLNSAAPCFVVADVGATIRWYEEHLGFEGNPFPQEEPFGFAILRRDAIEIMLQRIEGYRKPDLRPRRGEGVWDAYVRMYGLDEFCRALQGSVGTAQSPVRRPYGMRELEIVDPDGYVLVFAEPSNEEPP